MPLVSLILFVVAAVFAVVIVIGFAFKLIGFLIAAAIVVATALWISRTLKAR